MFERSYSKRVQEYRFSFDFQEIFLSKDSGGNKENLIEFKKRRAQISQQISLAGQGERPTQRLRESRRAESGRETARGSFNNRRRERSEANRMINLKLFYPIVSLLPLESSSLLQTLIPFSFPLPQSYPKQKYRCLILLKSSISKLKLLSFTQRSRR